MITRVHTSVLSGLAAEAVEVEVQVQNGLPRFTIIGLADNAIKEARDRVIAALALVGCELPDQILINLAPAEMRKTGVSMDLAIAVAVAAAAQLIPSEAIDKMCFIGELGLNGDIKPVRGVIAHAVLARKLAMQTLIISTANMDEALLVNDINVIGVRHISELLGWLRGDCSAEVFQETRGKVEEILEADEPFAGILGQHGAKRALQIAAVGGHHVLMVGPPGCGKTMLARSFSKLLPGLSRDDQLEVVSVHSVSGQQIAPLLRGERPFRAPHYGVSEAGLIGGGSSIRPGEISLAHRGVLFLDELPEFSRCCLEALRLPLEEGAVTVARARRSEKLPASFQLIAAMNPCPCGNGASPKCHCSELDVQRYLKKLSQPILDRIDIHTSLQAIPIDSLIRSSSQDVQEISHLSETQIVQAQEFALSRFGALPSRLTVREVQQLPISEQGNMLLRSISEKSDLSARGFHRMLKVACTISCMDGQFDISEVAIAEAYSLRVFSARSNQP